MRMKNLEEFFFGAEGRGPLAAAFLSALFLLGFFFWLRFFDSGNLPFGVFDWRFFAEECGVIQDAFRQGSLPWHFSPERYGTARFFSLPHLVVSPQVLLLGYLSPGAYLLASALLFYALGFAGCLLLRRRYGLSLYSFTFLFLLFNFNGNLVSHLAVGHTTWLAYFLLPFFALFLLEYLETRDRRAPLRLAAVLALTVYQGGYHLYVWCLLLLLVLALTEAQRWRDYFSVLAASALLSFSRLLPPFITYWDKKHEFILGFPDLKVLLDSLVSIRDAAYSWAGPVLPGLSWHEYDTYIGTFGLGMLLYFGIALVFRRPDIAAKNRFRALDLPLAVMAAFTLNYVYGVFRVFPVPLLNSERAPARFLLLVLFFLVLIAAVRFDDWRREARPGAGLKALLALGLLQSGFALFVHARAWSSDRLAACFTSASAWRPQIPAALRLEDPAYIFSVKFSAAVSLAALAYYSFRYSSLKKEGPGRA